MRCDSTYKGWRSKCNTRLEEKFDSLGNIVYRCPRCSLVARGRCWKCGDLRIKSLSAFCNECIKARARNDRKNYAQTKKGRKAILRYRQSEKGLENKREKAKKRYQRKKLEILQRRGYSSFKLDPSPPKQKSGYSCQLNS
jgi:hypothetical protein